MTVKEDISREFSQQKDIVLIYKGGWTSSNLFSYLYKNFRKLLHKYNKISLYIWVGTCDFTEKIGRFVSLRNKQPKVLERLCIIYGAFKIFVLQVE